MSSDIPVFNEKESFHRDFYEDYNISAYRDEPQEDLNRAEPHRHTYYEIIWIKKGHGSHLVDFEEHEFEGPCLFILNPGVVHKINKAVPTEGYVVKFSESFFAEIPSAEKNLLRHGLFDNIHPRPIFKLKQEEVSLLDDLMQKMLKEYRLHEEVSKSILLSYLKIFLLQVYKLREDQSGPVRNSPRHQALQQYKKLIEENFRQHHDLEFYAEALATSRRNLQNITQTCLGKPAKSLINERLLLEAKRMLYSGGQSVKEVAFELGFNDPAYFTRFFKKYVQRNPSEFAEEA